MIERIAAFVTEPFHCDGRPDRALLALFLAVNGLVLANACLHDPRIGYDARDHLDYVRGLSDMRLVTRDDTHEFFSPPLPYLPAALAMRLGELRLVWAGKVGQVANFALSVGLTFLLLRTLWLLGAGRTLRRCSLLFLGMLPVYYKTFAFVRGEPYVAFFAVLTLYYSVLILVRKRTSPFNAAMLGLAMGCCILSRQWGVMVFPAVYLLAGAEWLRQPAHRLRIAGALCLATLVMAPVGGWFYAYLNQTYGSPLAFNRSAKSSSFTFSSQPPMFYYGLSPGLLFGNPLRPNFANQFVPTFYADIWGDYWGYFVVYGKSKEWPTLVGGRRLKDLSVAGDLGQVETNFDTIGAYLGRVNLVSLYPSLLASIAIAAGAVIPRRATASELGGSARCFCLAVIGVSLVVYLWFVISYPNYGKGDTIKATYLLHVFPFVALLVGDFLSGIERRSRRLYHVLVAGLLLVCCHNLGAMITRNVPPQM